MDVPDDARISVPQPNSVLRQFIREENGMAKEIVTRGKQRPRPTVRAGHIHSKQDIDELYSLCRSLETEFAAVEVESIYDPIEFLLSGFLTYESASTSIITQYAKGWITIPEIMFWHGLDEATVIKRLDQVKDWVFQRLSYIKKIALKDVDSHALILYAPQELYNSFRPRTDMMTFLPPNAAAASRAELSRGRYVASSGERWSVIPVTRYAAGMSRGLFNEESEQGEYCGTFYYHESESDTFLAYKSSRTFFNKTAAVTALDPTWSTVENWNSEEEWLAEHPHLAAHMKGELPADLRMTPQEFYARYPDQIDGRIMPEFVSKLLKRKEYIGRHLMLYAEEDDLDQSICLLAKSQGIDLLILTHMVGSHQVVTEVLDTRDRVRSFENLIRVSSA